MSPEFVPTTGLLSYSTLPVTFYLITVKQQTVRFLENRNLARAFGAFDVER